MGLGLPCSSALSPLLGNHLTATSSNRGMPPPPPAAAVLVEELIEEILLRLPPDEPASLFRAALVCKPWCRLISAPRFRRRYREFHRSPPLLGFFCGRFGRDGNHIVRFAPTSASCSPLADRRCRLLDARHGCVLLLRSGEPGRENVLLVWDPITDEQTEVPFPKLTRTACTWKAAVVCAATAGGACDHLDCHRGAFLVVLVITFSPETLIWTCSSDAGSWSDPVFTQHHDDGVDLFCPSVLVGNALYFEFWSMKRVLMYDLEFDELSVVGLPSSFCQHVGVFRTTDDGRLGFATVHKSKLYMWSRKYGSEAHDVWTRDRVIKLEKLLSSNGILTETILAGFVDRIGVILLRTENAIFTIDMKTSKVKKGCDGASSIVTVVPYLSFYTPALGGPRRGEGPIAGGSSA